MHELKEDLTLKPQASWCPSYVKLCSQESIKILHEGVFQNQSSPRLVKK